MSIYSAALLSGLRPSPLVSVSEWADGYRYLPRKGSPFPGRWRTSTTPYLREPMDAMSISSPVEKVILMFSTQTAKTETCLNCIGYAADVDPSPVLYVAPTVEMAQRISRQRIASMIEDTPTLKALFRPARERDSGNTMLSKDFPGGILLLTGANSAAGLRSMPVAKLILDEIDAYPIDVEGEGSPLELAIRRTSNFPRRKILMCSTPTIKGMSAIESEFNASSMAYYYVPCPHCGEFQRLEWARITWDEGKPETARAICEKCGVMIDHKHKKKMLDSGEWRHSDAANPVKGYHLNALYSPWQTWAEMAADFIRAKGDTILLKTFINTRLAETWEEAGESIDDGALYDRRENFGGKIPAGVLCLTAGVDVQKDRIEATVTGWGIGWESWIVGHWIFYGDTKSDMPYGELDNLLLNKFEDAAGNILTVLVACIDSGGHTTQQVYSFCKTRKNRRVFAVKGASTHSAPIVSRPTLQHTYKIPLYSVGTHAIKDVIFSNLQNTEGGAGAVHFSDVLDHEYFSQLTAEKVITRHHRGYAIRDYYKVRERNEALDCFVYAFAAVSILNPNLNVLSQKKTEIKTEKPPIKPVDVITQIKNSRKKPGRGGYVNRWK